MLSGAATTSFVAGARLVAIISFRSITRRYAGFGPTGASRLTSLAATALLAVLALLTILALLAVAALLTILTLLAVLTLLTLLAVLTLLTILALLAVLALLTVLAVLTLLVVLTLLTVATLLTVLALLAVLALLTVLAILALLVVLTLLTVAALLSILALLLVVVAASAALVVVATLVVVAALVVVATVVVVTTVASHGEADAVILGSALGDRHQHGLVVGSRRHAADAVVAGGQATRDVGGQQAIAVAVVVDALEEGKLGGVQGPRRVEGSAGVLDGDVRVSNDLAVAVQVLGSRVISRGSVGEGAALEVEHLDLDLKVLVGGEVVSVLGVDKDARDHVVDRGDPSHGCRDSQW